METSKGVEEGAIVAKSFSTSMDFSLTVDGIEWHCFVRHLRENASEGIEILHLFCKNKKKL